MRLYCWIILVITSLVLEACSSSTVGRVGVAPQPTFPAQEYKIQAGDLLDIKLFYNPELNELLTVRPDGRITLQLINDIVAAGLTSAELTAVLIKAYAGELDNPKVAVIVRTSVAERVYVDGEVNRAGMIPLTGPTTILQSIAQAGGVKDTARTGEIILLRKGDDNKVIVFRLNLEDALLGEGKSQDVYLKSNDIVYIPKSAIANINTWVDMYLRKNMPIPLGLSLGTL